MLWILFFLLTAIIFFSGKNLVRYGDILAEKLNIGRTVIGVVFVASITSLPELITGISSVTFADSPDIATGNIFGSCMFNLLILAILDGFYRDTPITAKVHHGLTLSSSFGIILIAVSSTAILLKNKIPVIGWISFASLLIILIYLLAVKVITDYEKRIISRSIHKTVEMYRHISLKEASVKYLLNATVIIIASVFLPKVAKDLAHSYGMTETFFGTFFVAFATSFPEIAVSIVAAKMNMVTISVANLLGSNIFNIFVLAINDLFYTKGSLFNNIDISNNISAAIAILMSSIVIIGLVYRAEKKKLRLAYESIALIIVYITGVAIIYSI
ncbi:cation:H+ antiporter [Persephonella hydrogeniphila]|uniref:Cation:H+ antiporter n=1 Tax=Persephonella hydrogeniphila TaxID=198703 RepID=A0A285N3C9_9AQUI|nr:sodium:calcium antiporter [Persephonella hydrogeniphila]SNZ03327.1 cation:H+ antiporter [Persephonella hydrogeniphila]